MNRVVDYPPTDGTVVQFNMHTGDTGWTYNFPEDSPLLPVGNPILVEVPDSQGHLHKQVYVPMQGTAGFGMTVFDAVSGSLLSTQTFVFGSSVGSFPPESVIAYYGLFNTTELYATTFTYWSDLLYFPEYQIVVPNLQNSSQLIAWDPNAQRTLWEFHGDAAFPAPYTFLSVLCGIGNTILVYWNQYQFQELDGQTFSSAYNGDMEIFLENAFPNTRTASATYMNDLVHQMYYEDGTAPFIQYAEYYQRCGYVLLDVATGTQLALWETPYYYTTGTSVPGGNLSTATCSIHVGDVSAGDIPMVNFNAAFPIEGGQYLYDGVTTYQNDYEDTANIYYHEDTLVIFGPGSEVGGPGLVEPNNTNGTFIWTALLQDYLSYDATIEFLPWDTRNFVTDGVFIYFLPAEGSAPNVAAFFAGNIAAGPIWQVDIAGANAGGVSNGILQGNCLYVWLTSGTDATQGSWYVLDVTNGNTLFKTLPLTNSDVSQVLFDHISDEAMLADGKLVFFSQVAPTDDDDNYNGTLYVQP